MKRRTTPDVRSQAVPECRATERGSGTSLVLWSSQISSPHCSASPGARCAEGGESVRTCRTDRPEGPAGASAHPEAGVFCSTTQKGGGKTLTVLNLLAVPKTE